MWEERLLAKDTKTKKKEELGTDEKFRGFREKTGHA